MDPRVVVKLKALFGKGRGRRGGGVNICGIKDLERIKKMI